MFPIPGSSNVQETKGIPVIQFVRPKISSVLLSKSRSQLEMAASPHLQNVSLLSFFLLICLYF